MTLTRHNLRLLPLNILMIVGGLIWAGCSVAEPAVPAVVTPTTETTLDTTWPINGWTGPEAVELANAVASPEVSDEFNMCAAMTIVRTYTRTEVLAMNEDLAYQVGWNAAEICYENGVR